MSISQDWITNELEDTELEALHRSPSVEYSFYNAVRSCKQKLRGRLFSSSEGNRYPLQKSSDQPEVSFRCHYCHAHPLLY